MLILWILPLILLHASYYWAGGTMPYIRFFICLFPAFIGASFALVDKSPLTASRRWIAVLAFAAMVLGLRFEQSRSGISQVVSSQASKAVAECAKMLSSSLKNDAVIFSGWNCGSYLRTICSFRYYNLDVFNQRWGARSGWGIGVRQQEKRLSRLQDFYRNHSQKDLSEMKKETILKYLSRGRQVAFLISHEDCKRELSELGNGYELVPVNGFDTSGSVSQELGRFSLYELKKKETDNMAQ